MHCIVPGMPRLWNETIGAHREAVRDAVLDAAWGLVTDRGLASATMSRIAEKAGIGRATLYKYFPDVEAILVAWHDRHVAGHLEQLAALRSGPGDPRARLEAVLQAYAQSVHRRGRHAAEVVALLHRDAHVAKARNRLYDLIRGLLAELADAGALRGDVAPDELAQFCLHALNAAGELRSGAAVERLVKVTLSALR